MSEDNMDRKVEILKDVVRHPSDAFREIGENGEKYLPAALTVFFSAFLVSYFFTPVLFPLESFLMGAFDLFLYVILMYLFGMAMGGEAELIGLLSALGYAYFPSIILSFVFRIGVKVNIETIRDLRALAGLPREQIADKALPLLKELINPLNISLGIAALLLGIWSLVLVFFACRESHKFGTGKAILTIVFTILVAGVITSLLNL